MRRALTLLPFVLPSLLPVGGCSSDDASGPQAASADTFVLQTTEFTTPPGKEQYLCYTQTLTEDVVVDQIAWKATPSVHHVIMNQLLQPKPDGWEECATLFRPEWQFTFLAATGDATLPFPEGSGVTLKKGSQVMIQLHLLNASKDPVTQKARLDLRRSKKTDLAPIGIFALGKTALEIPAHASDATTGNDCELPDDVDLVYVMPHMHYLGKRMVVEAGPDWGELETVYERKPYSFDAQRIDPVSFQWKKGTKTRVTCTFDNPHDTAVTFGESSTDEMCFALFFARNHEGVSGCNTVPPVAGSCVPKAANEVGIGAPCHKGASDCPKGLVCTADQTTSETGFCFRIGCDSTAQCGSSAVCCAPLEAGGALYTCLPDACVPEGCKQK